MAKHKSINKVGIVAIPNISVGGGFARVVRDLIASLNGLNKKVYLLTPHKVELDKIKEFYGPIKLEKVYGPNKFRSFFCKEDTISRKLLKQEFIKMAKEVDLIFDIDGRILNNYLPKDFNKSAYVVWRVSCSKQRGKKKEGPKRKFKNSFKKIINLKKYRPRGLRVYAVDAWTKKDLIEQWGINVGNRILSPAIQVDHLKYKGNKKKDQMIIFGRISPNKSVEDSIKIFSKVAKKYPKYKLIILGGTTPDFENYIGYLNNLISELKLSDRVKVIKNPSFKQIKKILLESKILIDSQKHISITMTAIEALAAGCIVLAYKDAGTFLEVLENGKYGFGFSSVEEGGKNLEKILGDLKKGVLNSKKFYKRADHYSRRNFVKKIKEIIDET